MFAAIGTVLFWMVAAAGAFFVLFFGACMLAAVCGAISAPFRSTPSTIWSEREDATRCMTPRQRYQWANRIGPYA